MKLLITLLIVSAFTGNCFAKEKANPELPNIVVITTGGTIAEKIDPVSGGAVPTLSGNELLDAVPQLGKMANIHVVNFMNIDSSHMTPEIWATLSKKVDDLLKDPSIKGAVITHGTDTMAQAAFFLDITLKTKKPVVIVGAMRNASELSPDGPANIVNAVAQVSSPNAQNWGVTVSLNQYINSAWDVQKTQSYNVQTFTSNEKGYLGYVVQNKVYRLNDRLHRVNFDIPKKLPSVALFKTYPGDKGDFIRYAADNGSKGIVVEGLGAGNVNPEVSKAIEYALSKNVVVVISTSVFYGGSWAMYADVGGGASLVKAGAILGGSLSGFKANLLLMLAIAKEGQNPQAIKAYFKR